MDSVFELYEKYSVTVYAIAVIIGISLGYISSPIYFIIVLIIGVFLVLSSFAQKKNYAINRSQIASGICVLVVGLSMMRAYYGMPMESPVGDDISMLEVRIKSIVDRENSMLLTATAIHGFYDTDKECANFTQQDILVTIQGIDYSLVPGTVLRIPNKLERIKNMGNPDEFDYAGYMARKEIFYRCFLKGTEYQVVGFDHTLTTKAESIKAALVTKIMATKVSSGARVFLSAVTLGDKQFLDVSFRTLYSRLGISHILAISGLHIGLLSMLLYFMLYPIGYVADKRVKLLLSLCGLFAFAVIVGLSASVIRAIVCAIIGVLMFCLRRKVKPINMLSLAAIIILFINPLWIYDVGFQLSFVSVLFILIFSNKINPISRRHKFAYYISGLICVSLSAMAGTVMISAYYFHIIPILFLIPNIVCIPLLPILIIAGVVAVIFSRGIFCEIYNQLYNLYDSFLNYISHLPYCYVDNVHVELWQIVTFYSFMLALAIAIYNIKEKRVRIYTSVILASVFIILICSGNYFTSARIKNGFVVMNHRMETPILLYSDGTLNMPLLDAEEDSEYLAEFKQYNKNFLAKRNIDNIVSDTTMLYTLHGAKMFNYNDLKIAVVDSNLPKYADDSSLPVNCDYLILTKNYYASIKRALLHFNPQIIVLSGNIFPKRVDKLKREINDCDIKCHDMRIDGALIVE